MKRPLRKDGRLRLERWATGTTAGSNYLLAGRKSLHRGDGMIDLTNAGL